MRTCSLTLLMTDVKGYTERQARSSRKEIEDELRVHRTLLTPIFEGFGGRIVKTMGDAFLVAFESPTDAVHAAVQAQRALSEQNARAADPLRTTEVRIAISTGEVSVDDDGDVFGDPVNLAARLQAIAEPGTVYLTETTFLSMNRNEIPALEVGHRVFKGIPAEVKVYRILDEYVANARLMTPDEIRRHAHASGASRARGARSSSKALLLAILAALLVVGGGVAALLLSTARKPEPTELLGAGLDAAVRSLQFARRVENWPMAHRLAKELRDRYPGSDAARGFVVDVARWELESKLKADRAEELTRQTPPTWYETHLAGADERTKASPRYAWLLAVWLLASAPDAPATADALERALEVEPAARDDDVLRDLVQRAFAATVGKVAVHQRLGDALERMREGGDRAPAGGRRGTGPAMRDR